MGRRVRKEAAESIRNLIATWSYSRFSADLTLSRSTCLGPLAPCHEMRSLPPPPPLPKSILSFPWRGPSSLPTPPFPAVAAAVLGFGGGGGRLSSGPREEREAVAAKIPSV